MLKADIFVALFFLIIGILCIGDSIRIGFGWGINGPESGFLPFYLGCGVSLCSLIVFIKSLKKYLKDRTDELLMPKGALKPILWVLIPSTLMVVITELVGLHLAAAIYLIFYMRFVGKIGWLTTLIVGLATPLLLYLTFDKIFLIPLPQGLWGAKILVF